MKKIKAAVIGSTGYAGQDLVRLLLQHPFIELNNITSKSYESQQFSDIYENFSGHSELKCSSENISELANEVDIIFIALPHGLASGMITKQVLNSAKVIDLGADFRLNNLETYKHWYQADHNNQECLNEAVYGLCELKREKIKKARLIANPGCYTTCSILSIAPLLIKDLIKEDSIIIDAKSGVSGAGRALNIGIHYNECNESIKAYKIASHRHIPEIEQELSSVSNEDIKLTFTPHLVPMNRGILATSYAKLKKNITYEEVKSIYQDQYGKEYFIRLTKKGIFPETRWVKGSNFVDIGFTIDERTNRIVVVGAIDNLLKGAAGQAVQNMNIMFELEEKMGLNQIPMFPV